jgi:cellulose synthase/poly-beta-1,6-N-acetylglucosamine synthase-like glycosyltransferase
MDIPSYALRLPVIRGRVPLNWNNWVRQIHRWLSIIFTLTVVANLIAMAIGTPPSWIVYSPLPPLFLLMFTGLYMFVLPYAGTWRRRPVA